MWLSEICSFVAIGAFGSLMLYGLGMNFLGALAFGVLLTLGEFLMFNYLNHGKFRPFVSRSPVTR